MLSVAALKGNAEYGSVSSQYARQCKLGKKKAMLSVAMAKKSRSKIQDPERARKEDGQSR
eukprot:scaffold10229_cov129-Skeletonema_dohrnii-CCMP3373.AAC.3